MTSDGAPGPGGPDGAADRGTGGFGGSGGSGGSGGEQDARTDVSGPPAITATTPSHEDKDVAVDSSVVIEFSKGMDRTAVTVTFAPPVMLRAPAWSSSSDTVTLLPQTVFAAATLYTVTVAGQDAGGMALTGTRTFSFTTGMPPDMVAPTIASSVPAAAATNVPVNSTISVTFSEPMDPATVDLKLGDTALDVMLNDAGTVATVAAPDLAPSTMYTVTVAGADVAGNALGGTKTFSFTTGAPADAVRPTVLSTAPDSAATGVATTTEIAITFSEPMNRAATEGAITISGGVACAGRWLWNGTSTFTSCRPAAPLATSTGYTVTISTAAADPAGNTLMAAHMFSFMTAAAADTTPPTVASVSPANASTGVVRTSNIVVTFSEPMDLASAQTAFQATVNGVAVSAMGTYTWSNGGRTLTFDPTSSFAYGATVAFSISMAAKDAAGNPKAAVNNYSFTVIRYLSATLYATAALDGYVYSSGSLYSTLTSILTGDLSNNLYAHGFLSFDLKQLNVPAAMEARSQIISATLYVNQTAVTGNPYAVVTPAAPNLGSLLADHVNYGPTLDAADLMTSTLGARTYTLSTSSTAGTKLVSVTAAVADDWTNRVTRTRSTQFRLRFTRNLTNNSMGDYARFVSADDATNTTMRPRLIIGYETP